MDCEWSDWQIGQCSVTCGRGNRTNTRSKLLKEKNGGVCTGEATAQEVCNNPGCPGNIDLFWTHVMCYLTKLHLRLLIIYFTILRYGLQ